jgi:hypothetical protein
LRQKGLFYLGQYGGVEQDGVYEGDHYEPKRYFSFVSDEMILDLVMEFFEIINFKIIELDEEEDFHFQSLILRKC